MALNESDDIFSLTSPCTAAITVKRSRFIANIAPAADEGEAKRFIADTSKRYSDARHNVFAYILPDGLRRCSDDGEPSGTAGPPVLAVLAGRGLRGCAAVVTRYFGGVLLGEGGLVRAYSDAVRQALESAGTARLVAVRCFVVRCGFEIYGPLASLLASMPFVKADAPVFGGDVAVTCTVPEERADEFVRRVRDSGAGRCALDDLGKKFAAAGK